MYLTKVIAVDASYAHVVAKQAGLPFFPIKEFREHVSSADGTDVLETLVTVVQRTPDGNDVEDVATAHTEVTRLRHALEYAGARVIIAPSKPTPDGDVKQSDDQHLVIATLSTCLRLRPRILTFIGADGDFAPLVWELRREGIRTEVVATPEALAADLRRAAWSVVDLHRVLEHIRPDA